MSKSVIAILTLLFFSWNLFGQEIDSLYLTFSKAKQENKREAGRDIIRWLTVNNFSTKGDSVFLDHSLSDREYELKLTDIAVRYLFRMEYYDMTFDAAQNLLHLAETAKDTTCLIHAYYFMGFASQRMGKMDDGLHYNQRCYELCREAGDIEMTSSVLNNLGNIYTTNGQDSMAVIYFLKTIETERILGRKQNLATRLGNLALVYNKLGDHDKALASVTEGLALDREIGRADKIAIRLHQMCEVYMAMGNYEKAKSCSLEAVDYFRQAKSPYGLAVVLCVLGEIEEHFQQTVQAEQYYLEALTYAQEIENKLLIQRVSQLLYTFYRNRDANKALAYFERSVELKDSIFTEENRKQLNEFQVKYETAEKELKIERQENIIKQQQTERRALFAGLAITLLVIGLVVYNLRLRSQRAKELVEMNATKDRFFSIISHDLKNPAISQRVALQGLLHHIDQWDTHSLRKYCEELLRSADGQIELLYNLLNWAQVQTGRMPFRPRTFDLVAEWQNELSLLKTVAERKGVTLIVNSPESVLVKGDANMLLTVIRNLVGNAIKFCPKGKTATLAVQTASNVKISVADEGVGMSAEQLSNLFRLDVKRTTRGTAGEDGSGLGLIVCKELLVKHGAQLHVDSELGKGSCFWFELPHLE